MKNWLLVGVALAAACGKGSTSPTEAAAPKKETTASSKPAAGPEPKLPASVLAGLDLDAEARARFFALYDKAPSPCGKAQSLHQAVDGDASCKRAPFAARFLARWVADGRPNDEQVLGIYTQRYERAPATFDLKGASHVGDPNTAKITYVEFFDYACPHCKLNEAMVAEAEKKFGKDLVVYYMNFPIGNWPTSEPAARAAVAADRQGKFEAFHRALFDAQEHQEPDEVRKLAKQVGLDMKRFEADWKDPAVAALVSAQREQGVKVGLHSTPMIWINGRELIGTAAPGWLTDAIDEELAAASK